MTDQIPSSDKSFATWCAMEQARPVLVRALRVWGLGAVALPIEQAASTSALKLITLDADNAIRRIIRFVPLRRDLAQAASTLSAAATFAGRGDAANAASMALVVVTNAESAIAWRTPWLHIGWRARRIKIMESARQAQRQHLPSN